ncbi:MAG: ATP-NAD kinase, partial [Clostridia bacterium]|nr:ATP-NAD kinase [Clostridia bacterium]
RIEIYKNGKFSDIALIDAVISKKMFIGSRAIWDLEDIIKVIVSRCHPASIGFSSLLGCRTIITEEDDFGAYADINCNNNDDRTMAPIAAGVIKLFNVSQPEIINFDQEYFYEPTERGIIALDGEREIPFKKEDKIVFKIVRKGPNRVNIKKAIEVAQRNGFFICKK